MVSNDNGIIGIGRLQEGDEPTLKGRMALLAYDLAADGTAKFRKVLVDYAPQDGPDGLVCDVEGNLYVAVRDETRPGICVYSPEGKELAYIKTGSADQRRLRPRRREQHALHHRAARACTRSRWPRKATSCRTATEHTCRGPGAPDRPLSAFV